MRRPGGAVTPAMNDTEKQTREWRNRATGQNETLQKMRKEEKEPGETIDTIGPDLLTANSASRKVSCDQKWTTHILNSTDQRVSWGRRGLGAIPQLPLRRCRRFRPP